MNLFKKLRTMSLFFGSAYLAQGHLRPTSEYSLPAELNANSSTSRAAGALTAKAFFPYAETDAGIERKSPAAAEDVVGDNAGSGKGNCLGLLVHAPVERNGEPLAGTDLRGRYGDSDCDASLIFAQGPLDLTSVRC